MTQPDPNESSGSRLISRGLLLLAIILAIVIRCRLASMPLERDEGEFAYLGQLILRGIPPYKRAYSMKLPGTFLAYAGIMALFGQSASGIHLGLLAANLVTIVLIYRLTVSLFDLFAAGVAAVAYSLLSVSSGVLGTTAHSTHFVALFSMAGAFVLWKHLESNRLTLAFLSGLLFGIAFLMKQHAVFFIVFGMMAIICREFFHSDRTHLWMIVSGILLGLGAVLPYGLICVWLFWAGVWREFVFWTVTYAGQYVQKVSYGEAFQLLASTFMGFAGSWTLWLLALLGVLYAVLNRTLPPGPRLYALGWLVCSTACVVPGLLFRQHYFIAMLPAVAMFAGFGASALWKLVPRMLARWDAGSITNELETSPMAVAQTLPERRAVRRAVGLLLFGLIGLPLAVQARDFFVIPAMTLCRQIYGFNPFLESPAIAKYLREHTDPSDTISIFGSEPELLFEAGRDTCTGYIYTYSLVEPQPFARRMQDEMIEQVERGQPKYIVTVNIWDSWLVHNDEKRIFQWMEQYLGSKYQLVGRVDYFPDRVDFHWDEDATKGHANPQHNIQVYRRKD